MSAPSVYLAINAIMGELATQGIAKRRTNEIDDYKYRSIDDVLDRLAPLLSKHRLCVLPCVLERVVTERADEQKRLLMHVAVRVSFALTSVDDGSVHIVEAYGEALDAGDKATPKAMSAAYKIAMVQSFCIPVCATEDPDRTSHRLTAKLHASEPLQGWRQWCLDIEDIVGLCESEEAIAAVQHGNRSLLKALAREEPQLYAELGQAFVSRREVLGPRSQPVVQRHQSARRASKTKRSQCTNVEHA